ncbi:type VI secretion system tube protein Hcp [Yersinia enterocolitica]|uniref:type VI secretion system tube protein Hcp n=1 Tax=Yersinia enterocolitica TaxID=630 RepID=UPI001C8DCEDF|nr:type VI secretion system tube protein Hcp [Yersinia enterocolitica]EKN4180593.1 type VI secretion system tube protein Hcp [Yersinia enterocolitica]MBX9488943.1 type VI secretion system tube protein Hcp [Yersinia enterocolitica]MBX9494218.1 type VI secretion system tube protein Hcp [Yersinia enterocolitica]HEN3447362.1 type VI secretion system tube protein Hcp [Yersinia enterocolitica]
MSDVNTLFIKFTDIPGTANVKGYTDYIPIDNLNFSTFASVNPDSSGVLSSGGVSISVISFTKTDDFNSDELLSAKMLDAESFKEVIIVKVTTNKGKVVENRKITLNNVCIAAAETNLLNNSAATNHYSLVTSSFKRESNTVSQDGQTKKIGPKGFNFVTAEKQ